MKVPVLDGEVRVLRDAMGIPYIYADSFDDALRAQGFLIGQDRLLQMEVVRHLSQGRLAELIGSLGLKSDIRMRVVGVPRLGRAKAAALSDESRRWAEFYLEGLNTYIEDYGDEHQLGLRTLGVEPQPWTVEDLMIVNAFTNWSSTGNLEAELVAQAIADTGGPLLANEISMVTINPDEGEYHFPDPVRGIRGYRSQLNLDAWSELEAKAELGSNHWVMSPERSASGAPVLANNPHVDSRQLPGIWYPVGIVTPDLRVVGASAPGALGYAVARTEHITYGVTNSYGDAIDLYIETVDPANPDNYLEDGESIPFEVVEETLLVRNRKSGNFFANPLTIRYTKRGPVISDHGLAPDDSLVLSMRWSAPEAISNELALPQLMHAKNIAEAREAIAKVDAPYNYSVADTNGDIAHFTAGRVPKRVKGDGSRPLVVTDGKDSWDGMIPSAEMPHSINPQRGWVGNANHRTLPEDYPYAYSTYFAHSWRYERMQELLDNDTKLSAEDHWRYMQDVKNVMAEKVTPYMIRALVLHRDTGWIAGVLRQWDFNDDADQLAPLMFQAIYNRFAYRTFSDELGEELAQRMLLSQYYWQQRLLLLLAENENHWFDDRNTFAVETRDDLFYLAAKEALAELENRMGEKPGELTWGDLHTVTFSSPVVPGKAAARWIGGGTHPHDGSGETLNRGKFKFDKPYDSTFIDSMRFVADLGDPDKVMGVVSGGVSGRLFDEHLSDQMELLLSGEPAYWWFSDAAIEYNAKTELNLLPK